MNNFRLVYIPVGVPTFHLESAKKEFEKSKKLLEFAGDNLTCPNDMLLSIDSLNGYISDLDPDLVIFQNLTFANAGYISQVLQRFDCPILLWTLREPIIDGGRLRLNSLTGAFSAGNAIRAFGNRHFDYVFGSPEESRVANKIFSVVKAAEIKKQMKGLKIAAIGHTPQGFGFGRALDIELMKNFGAELECAEVRELINKAKSYSAEECSEYGEKSCSAMCGLENTPEKNFIDYCRLYRAYTEYIHSKGIGAVASRCWPDLFTDYGTPVCTVLSMLNDDGIAAACEADVYGALSMWISMKLSGEPVFFGDPVSLNEDDNSITFWHCGAAACSLARRDTGAKVGVHPNRKIGPAMDFGCEAFPEATVFRINRQPDGRFRFFIFEGEALDREKQFNGTSIVVRSDARCREIVEESVLQGLEPHFVVLKGRHASALTSLAGMLGFEVLKF